MNVVGMVVPKIWVDKKVRSRQMPHSLRAKLKGLNYKKILTDRELERLCKALDNENATLLDQIWTDICDKDLITIDKLTYIRLSDVLEAIEKYRK